jgi:hypothetical protein
MLADLVPRSEQDVMATELSTIGETFPQVREMVPRLDELVRSAGVNDIPDNLAEVWMVCVV